MKLTNEALKRIIKQELNNVLKEMRYPGGHPDDQFLRKVRRDDAGIDPMFRKKIEDLEKEDPETARELAVALGSQEYIEVMPDDPENVMQLKNDIVDMQVKIGQLISSDSEGWKELTTELIKMIDELHATLDVPMPDPFSGDEDLGDQLRPRTRFHRRYQGDHGPLKVFSPGKMGVRLSEE